MFRLRLCTVLDPARAGHSESLVPAVRAVIG